MGFLAMVAPRPRALTITIDTSAISERQTQPTTKGSEQEGAIPHLIGALADDKEALLSDPGREEDFIRENNPFCFAPGQLNKLVPPKSIAAFYALGGLAGLEHGLGATPRAHKTPTVLRQSPSSPCDEVEATINRRTLLIEELAETQTINDSKLRNNLNYDSDLNIKPNLVSTAGQTSEDRKRIFGDNTLPQHRSRTIFDLAWIAYNDKVLILLTVCAVIALALGIYQAIYIDNGPNAPPSFEWIEGVAIIVAIIVVVLVGALNDWQKQRQFVKLNAKKDDRTVKVIRSGAVQEISVHQVLASDLLQVEPGDVLPVDKTSQFRLGQQAWRKVSDHVSRLYAYYCPQTRPTSCGYSVAPVSLRSSTKAMYEPSVPGKLNGASISALPDLGASANFIDLNLVRQQHAAIDTGTARVVRKANGSFVRTLGSVMLGFRFQDEPELHQLEFHVLPTSSPPVILGGAFLKATKTLSHHFARRVQRVLRQRAPVLRVNYLSARDFVRGSIAGKRVDALPDTGSDVTLMSTAYAKQRGFKIGKGKRHKKLLEFMDGSQAYTTGVVRNVNWRYDVDESDEFITNVYVLDDLQCDVILSYDFLCHSNYFQNYQACSFEVPDHGDAWALNFIRLGEKRKKKSPSPTPAQSNSGVTPQQEALYDFQVASQQAEQLPEDQRETFLTAQRQRYHDTLAAHASARNGAQFRSNDANGHTPGEQSGGNIETQGTTPRRESDSAGSSSRGDASAEQSGGY